MNRLPENFEMLKYGLNVRLVTEKDAAFILELRTNERLSRHIHSTEDDLSRQIQWIRDYKKREFEGREYYFIYFKNNQPIGVNRVSNIYSYFGLGGSWLCSPDNDPLDSMKTPFIAHDICFEEIGLDYIVFDVRKANKQVWKFHESAGAVKIGESELDYYYYLYKVNYFNKRNHFLRLFNG